MLLHLSYESYGIALYLPATQADIADRLSALREGCETAAPVHIVGVSSPISNLFPYVRSANLESESDIQKLNCLAAKIGDMDQRESSIFSGALNTESVSGLDDILHIASHLDDYELIATVICDRDLGEYLVEHDLLGVNFPAAVRPYLDYVAIGAEYYSDHGGAYTRNGYVIRKEDSPEMVQNEGGQPFPQQGFEQKMM